MTDTLETKGALAPRKKKYMRGVYYDKRIRKFTAGIRVAGKRIYLGAFETEDDAAAAHALVRHDNPIRRGGADGGLTFAEAYDEFLQDQSAVTGQPKGVLIPGVDFFAPNGQRYFLVRIDTVTKPGRERVKWVYYRWHSNCSECKADFVTSTLPSKRNVGMTRTCAKHRKGGPSVEEPMIHHTVLKAVRNAQEAERQADADLEEISEAVYQQSLLPGSTRADLNRVRLETTAKIAARRAAQDDTLV